jgi:hypothetical protein
MAKVTKLSIAELILSILFVTNSIILLMTPETDVIFFLLAKIELAVGIITVFVTEFLIWERMRQIAQESHDNRELVDLLVTRLMAVGEADDDVRTDFDEQE